MRILFLYILTGFLFRFLNSVVLYVSGKNVEDSFKSHYDSYSFLSLNRTEQNGIQICNLAIESVPKPFIQMYLSGNGSFNFCFREILF